MKNQFYSDIIKVINKHSSLSVQEISDELSGKKFKVPTQLIAGWKRAATVRNKK